MPTETQRVFFALWPGDDVRQAIDKRFHSAPQSILSGRWVATENYHITLHFIGAVSPKQRQCMHLAAEAVESNAFSLTLDRFGHFYTARVFWMGCQSIPRPLLLLHKRLQQSLSGCGYQAESRVYAPHVSLMRKLLRPGNLISPEPILWQVSDFVLVESKSTVQGVKYEVLEHYPLVS